MALTPRPFRCDCLWCERRPPPPLLATFVLVVLLLLAVMGGLVLLDRCFL